MLCDDLEGWEQEGGSWGRVICIFMADSRSCMAETNTIFQGNYPPIKIFLKKKKKEILLHLSLLNYFTFYSSTLFLCDNMISWFSELLPVRLGKVCREFCSMDCLEIASQVVLAIPWVDCMLEGMFHLSSFVSILTSKRNMASGSVTFCLWGWALPHSGSSICFSVHTHYLD